MSQNDEKRKDAFELDAIRKEAKRAKNTLTSAPHPTPEPKKEKK